MKFRSTFLLYTVLAACPVMANDSAASYYESALRYSQQQQMRAAELELRNSLQRDPSYLPARLMLGKILLQANQWASAEKELQLALDGGAAPNPLVFDLMRAQIAQQKITEVSALLQRFSQYEQEPAYQLIQARLLQSQGNLTAAAAQYQQVLQHPKLAELADETRLEYGRFQFQQQQFPIALAMVTQITAGSPLYRPARQIEAQIRQLEQPEAALKIYDELLQQQPDDAAALLSKAQLILQQGDLSQALKLILQFREQYPDNPYGQLIHAALLNQQGQTAESERMIRQIQHQLSGLTSEAREQQDILLLGAILDFTEARLDQAIRKLTSYQKKYPPNVRVHQLLAQSYFLQERYQQAIPEISAALAMAPLDSSLYLLASAIYQAAEQFEQAKTVLQKGYEFFPDDALIRQSYAQILVRQGQSEEARKVLASPNADQQAEQLLLGYLQLEANLLADASATANALLAQDQGKVEIYQFAGDIAVKQGDAKAAEKFFQEALALDATSKPALLSLASLALNTQRVNDAMQFYQRILAATPDDSLTLQLLADAALKTGEMAQAIQALEQLSGTDRALYPARLALLELYLAEQQLEKAVPLLKQLETQADLRPELYLAHAKIAILQQNSDVARHNTDILFGLWFDNADRLLVLADLQLRNRDKDAADKSIQRLTALDAEPAAILVLQIRLALQRQQYALAEQQLKKLTTEPAYVLTAQELTAQLYLTTARTAQAIPILEALYQQLPDARIFSMLLTALRDQTDKAPLQKQLTQQLSTDPTDLAVMIELAELHINQNDAAAAIRVYRTGLQYQQHPVLLNNLADLLIESEPKEALDIAKKAHDLLPQHPMIAATYAQALTANGEATQALGILRDAEIRQPNNPNIQLYLAYALLELKRSDEAKRILSALQTVKWTHPRQQQRYQQLNSQLR